MGSLVRVYLGLGSNTGDRAGNLTRAVALLNEAMEVEAISPVYETAPVGYQDQPWFLNAALGGSTALSPEALLAEVKGIEARMGRTPSFRNAPRPIDIDILLYGSLMIETSSLIVPHPRMHERAFVLAPLAAIAPEEVHPALRKTVASLQEERGMSGVRWWGELAFSGPADWEEVKNGEPRLAYDIHQGGGCYG